MAKNNWTKKQLNKAISKLLAANPAERIDLLWDFVISPHCLQNSKKMDQTLDWLPNIHSFIDI